MYIIMKSPCGLLYSRIALLALVVISSNTESCHAFPPKPFAYSKSFSSSSSSSSSSKSSSTFSSLSRLFSSVKNNAQRRQRKIPRESHGHHPTAPLRQSSIPIEFEVDRTAWEQGRDIIGVDPTSRVSTVVDSAWSAVSKKFEVLTLSSDPRQIRQPRRFFVKNGRNFASANTRLRSSIALDEPPTTNTIAPKPKTISTFTTTDTPKLSKMDISMLVTYFCNIAVVTLSVVTVPAMAMEYNLSPHDTAVFCAGVAGLAPLGGVVGKLINGFVCQNLGGQRSSWIYMLVLSALSLAMSFSTSLAPVGLCLIGFEFLTSIQWTAVCHVFDQNYRRMPIEMARGIALLSISSTVGALAAKTFGAGMIQATNWRTVCRLGSVVALVGASAMYLGGGKFQKPVPLQQQQQRQSIINNKHSNHNNRADAVTTATNITGGQRNQSPLAGLKIILKNPIFWMIGIGHSLGYLARGHDRLLGPFLQEFGGVSSTLAAGLTSSVTIGFVLGLIKGNSFSKMESVKEKMNMIKNSYIVSVLSTLGLALCGIHGMSKFIDGNSNLIAAAITLFSGIIASTVSFQFYQFPNLVSATVFPENSAVALSLTDAIGYFVTASILGVNTHLLGNFGWSTAWAFMAVIFGIGGAVMIRAIEPVLIQSQENQRRLR
mmetsp:Transcript_53760/g.60055  ORF Transcript_53760/g.60055 Transcript_53760/m.60055 type:complete len:657 (+) Transcript_53760:187-2157(+)|eukprot:CAMPEP_0170781894 /NCGR_PEP_ID=MMETSP0733-20121128/14511_1 /TAXON_ID=186038 /ORGANISM="Fragilariopsis kerguelensis, Strain L26-C5" /LENGTH=656 /DNA_ID=CAMNT_0011126101 /DNA_START=67 /DNA_END=2037 /DNA_ORIENTATION=+